MYLCEGCVIDVCWLFVSRSSAMVRHKYNYYLLSQNIYFTVEDIVEVATMESTLQLIEMIIYVIHF